MMRNAGEKVPDFGAVLQGETVYDANLRGIELPQNPLQNGMLRGDPTIDDSRKRCCKNDKKR